MAVGGALNAATGGYTTTGAFSLEVLRRPDDPDALPEESLGEHFFVIGPSRVQYQTNWSISARATYDGVSVVDSGATPGTLQLSGEIQAHHSGPVRTPRTNVIGDGDPGATAARAATRLGEELLSAATAATGLAAKPGFRDFFDLHYLMYESRLDGNFESRHPVRGLNLDSDANGAHDIWQKILANDLGPLDFESTALVFRDYDRGMKLEVIYADRNAYQVTQSAERPHAWQWSLSLVVVRDLGGVRPRFRLPVPDVANSMARATMILDSLSFEIQGGLNQIAGIVSAVADLKNAKAKLQTVVSAFREGASDSIDEIRGESGIVRGHATKLRDLLDARFFGSTSPLSAIAAGNPAERLDYTLNPLVVQGYQLQTALSMIDVAMLRAANQLRSRNSRVIKQPAGVRSFDELAVLLHNDLSRSDELRKMNGVGDDSLFDDPYLLLRVPGRSSDGLRTGILIEHPARLTVDTAAILLYGEDLALTEDRDIAWGPDGDLASVRGLDALVQHLLDRLRKPRGTIPFFPEWGAAILPGELPDDVLRRADPDRTLENLYRDPAVQTAAFALVDLSADRLEMQIRVTPIGDGETIMLSNIKRRRQEVA